LGKFGKLKKGVRSWGTSFCGVSMKVLVFDLIGEDANS
jgi:hypothetical protein